MKSCIVALGLLAAIAVSDAYSGMYRYNRLFECGSERAVRCIGPDGDLAQDTQMTLEVMDMLSNERVCRCTSDYNHVYMVADDNFNEAWDA
ncbi:hypothetical protein BGX28_006971, partial [Mortierella sp. GBA30]